MHRNITTFDTTAALQHLYNHYMPDLLRDENEASLLRPIKLDLVVIWLKYYQYHTINQSIDRSIDEHHRKVFLCIQRGVIILDTKHHPKDMMKMVKICKGVI